MNEVKTGNLRVLIADDHAMIREMLEMYLAGVPDIETTTVADLYQALDVIKSDGPFDLVLVDLDMPGMDGVNGLRKAIEQNGSKPVGILTSNPSPQVVEEVMALGGAGIVLKTASLKNLANELRFMAGGGRYLAFELVERRQQAPVPPTTSLSRRETEVMALLAEGKPNREIGDILGLAEPTVKMHVKSICKKLGASNRTQAVIVARDRDLI
ncbi:MAG: LuxR C-terminal-related transcriptional regulator [Paracoccus sp. (in: a-proteobacteria)]